MILTKKNMHGKKFCRFFSQMEKKDFLLCFPSVIKQSRENSSNQRRTTFWLTRKKKENPHLLLRASVEKKQFNNLGCPRFVSCIQKVITCYDSEASSHWQKRLKKCNGRDFFLPLTDSILSTPFFCVPRAVTSRWRSQSDISNKLC